MQSKDHESEINFLQGELESKANFNNIKSEKLWIGSYAFFSDYGRSVSKPLIWMSFLLVVFGLIYSFGFTFSGLGLGTKIALGFKLSAASLFPFIPISKLAFKATESARLFTDADPYLQGLIYMESFFGIMLLFLIGLALRNRFRI